MAQKWMESRALGGVSGLALCAGLSLFFVTSAGPAQAQFGWFGARAEPVARAHPGRHYVRSSIMRRHAQRHGRAKATAAKEEPAKPIVGPLIISISINKQHLTVYDGERPVASTVISTGVKGHETPFGVFSVLQKELLHHSNLYSNAPMPHMQRITWSGVALHAGHATGRTASHGCIRLPAAFATRLYGMTKVGARVIITRNEVAPTGLSSPRLFTLREVAPVPTAAAPGGGESPAAAPGQGAALGTGARDNAADRGRAAGQVASLDRLPIPLTDAASPGAAREAPKQMAAAELPPSAYAEMAPTVEEIAAAGERQRAEAPAQTAPASQAALPPAQAITATPAAKPAMPTGPISIFVSRKEKKLFVRQNFKPIYETPIAFDGDQPLGTHVFTATNAPADGATLHWVIVSIASANPALSPELKTHRSVATRDARSHKVLVQPALPPAPAMSSPGEALERVQITPEVRDQIAAMITPGSSLVISDKGLGGETSPKGGTDFIVLTH